MEFRHIRYNKIDWFGNDKIKKSGAMDYVIKNKKENEKIIHIQHPKKGNLWSSVGEEILLNLIEKDIHLFEVLSSYPKKIYFDIDGDPNNTNLEEMKEIINDYFPDNKMAISGYEDNERFSYHIILSNYLILNEKDLDELKLIVKYFNSINSNFDWKVYTKNRNMKAINQSKPNKKVQKIIQDDNKKNHLINSFIPVEYLTIPSNIIQRKEIENIKFREHNTIDYSKLITMEIKNIDGIDIDEPLELLKITPLDKNCDHCYTHKVARFCYYNNIKFDDFIKWYKNKSNNNLEKWKYHWERLNEFPPITIKQYTQFLKIFYPNIGYEPFYKNWEFKNEHIKKIDSLSIQDFNNDKKTTIINIGMGGGKTIQTINYLKGVENFCWITPNISLAHNTFTRLKKNNVKCNIYDSAKNKKKKAELIENSQSILICLNSLFYIKKNYQVVVIDEIETFLKLFYNNSTIKHLDDVWTNFINLLINSKKIILLDAFISNMTINFLKSLNISYDIIQREKEESNRKAIIQPNFNYWFNDIIKNIINNKKVIIFYPYKNSRINLPSMASMKETIEKITNKKGIFHNAEASDIDNKKLKDVNKYWIKYDFVISNNKINVGLNFDLSYFDLCYLSIAGFNSPRDIIQFSYRARELKDNMIKYCFLDKINTNNGEEKRTVKMYNDKYQSLFYDVSIEKYAPLVDTIEFFLNKAGYHIENKNLYNELNQKIKFLDNDFYDYNKIDEYDKTVINDLEKEIYMNQASTIKKLVVKKYYFKRMFKKDTQENIIANLWNDNKFNFIENIKKVLCSNHIINKLKKNYGWQLYFPNDVDKKFKFIKEDLEELFNNFKFKDLTTKSHHHLILKTYINTIYGQQLIISKTDKNKHHKYIINDKIKNCFINIVENIKPIENPEFTD